LDWVGLDLEEVVPGRKSLVASRSFGRPIESLRELEEVVSVDTARLDNARSMARMTAIDAINARYCPAGERQVGGLRREFISPRYTDRGKICCGCMRGEENTGE
jgi:hypothetical protein